MALQDWEIIDKYGSPVTAELRTDVVFEGSRSVRFGLEGEWYIIAVHKQTLADKPVSGAVKTAVYILPLKTQTVGLILKYLDYQNYLLVTFMGLSQVEVRQIIDGGESILETFYLSTTYQEETWYFIEAIFDDPTNTVVFRLRDTNDNILEEHSATIELDPKLKGAGGGMGLYEEDDTAYFDLTKIYY